MLAWFPEIRLIVMRACSTPSLHFQSIAESWPQVLIAAKRDDKSECMRGKPGHAPM